MKNILYSLFCNVIIPIDLIMGLKIIEIAVTLIQIIHCTFTEHILPCNNIEACSGDYQICNASSQECVCMRGFVRVDDECRRPDAKSNGTHIGTTVIVTALAIALIACGLVLVVRKYNLLEYIQQKLRRDNDILYEDVMIGQDDPPLSP